MEANLIQTIVVYALPVIFAITLHEAAHGYVARMLGDDTAYVLGRVSFNPMRHIDPIGTIAMPLVLYFLTNGAFVFGYAKPVPIAFSNLRNPRWGTLWVAAAMRVKNGSSTPSTPHTIDCAKLHSGPAAATHSVPQRGLRRLLNAMGPGLA